MSARSFVATVALFLAGCAQEYHCQYRCGASGDFKSADPVTAVDASHARSECAQKQAASCTSTEVPGEGTSAGPVHCECAGEGDSL
jgi:hypothetical protein